MSRRLPILPLSLPPLVVLVVVLVVVVVLAVLLLLVLTCLATRSEQDSRREEMKHCCYLHSLQYDLPHFTPPNEERKALLVGVPDLEIYTFPQINLTHPSLVECLSLIPSPLWSAQNLGSCCPSTA